MKKTILFTIILLTLTSYKYSKSDKNVSCVTYRIGRVVNLSANQNLKSEEVKKHVLEMSQAYDIMEFKLYFTKNKSIFDIIDKLNNINEFSFNRALNRVKGCYYKDLISKEKIKSIEFAGNLYNITVPFDEYKWNITNETKMISGYKCYKATCVYEEYDTRRKKNLVFNPEVWFAPKIPFPFGPRGLDGLPGLVLEGKFSSGIYFYATDIKFSLTNKNIDIEKPNKGIFVSDEEYKRIQIELIDKIK